MVTVFQVILIIMIIVSFLGMIAESDKDLRVKLLAVTISCIIAFILMPILNVLFL